jgi:copper chaperone CopZ
VLLERERPVAEVGEDRRSERPVVLDEVALRRSELGPVDPVEIREVRDTLQGYMDETTYRVPGMSCAHCERAVSEELSAVAGVESVTVDLDSKLVVVRGRGLDDATLRAAIEEAGYEAA